MRATAPPMIDGSTLVSSCTWRPVALREPLLQRRDAVRRQRHGGRDFGADDLRVLHQPRFVGGGDLGQQHEPIALGQHQQQLRRRSGDMRPARASSCSTTARLRGAGIAGLAEHARQRLVAGDEPRERGELAADLLDVAFLARDVEQRARVAGGGARGSSSRLPAAAPRSDRPGASDRQG